MLTETYPFTWTTDWSSPQWRISVVIQAGSDTCPQKGGKALWWKRNETGVRTSWVLPLAAGWVGLGRAVEKRKAFQAVGKHVWRHRPQNHLWVWRAAGGLGGRGACRHVARPYLTLRRLASLRRQCGFTNRAQPYGLRLRSGESSSATFWL